MLLVLTAFVTPGRVLARTAADTTSFRVEIGIGADVANELFYEDAFVDTVALGRRLVSDPEARYAGLVTAFWRGTRGGGSTRWELVPEASIGDLVQRGTLAGDVRHAWGDGWRLSMSPRIEYRRDRTFSRDLEEVRGSARGRAQRRIGEASRAGIGADFDILRTHGDGADFLPDRQSGRVSASFERLPLTGLEWRAEGALTQRQFPDSSVRDHHEARGAWDARWTQGGTAIDLSLDGVRRWTRSEAPTSRDRFSDATLAIAGTGRSGGWLGAFVRGTAERFDYEDPDSTFYDYGLFTLHLGPMIERGGWVIRAGPRGELLASDLIQERYHEVAAAIDFEWTSEHSWWGVAPAAGWRQYDDVPAATEPGLTPLSEGRTSYAFYELDLTADPSLGGGWRARATATGRLEFHTDAANDSRSLYFSIEVRRLF